MNLLGQIQLGVNSNGAVASQFETEPVSIKTQIADALLALMTELPKLRQVDFDRVRLSVDDYHDSELPAAQFIDNNETVTHERARKFATWNIVLEIVDKSDENGYISQRSMWNLEYQIARKLWAHPNLGVKGVQQMTYLNNSTDLHMLDPYYLLRMEFQVQYQESLVREC